MTPPLARLLVLFLASILTAAVRSAQEPDLGAPATPHVAWATPNVLVILADDIGWRDIDPSIPTPNIDALVRDGVTFRRAYSMPYCSPSRFALLFGMQPFREQLGTYIDPNLPGEVTVSTQRLSLPGLLKGYGYDTLAAGKWHLSTFAIGAQAALEWPRRFGFQAFRAGRIGNIGGTVTYIGWPRIDDGVQTYSTEYNTNAIRASASDWWNRQQGPRFAYVAFHAAHAPFHVPPARLLPPGYVVGTSNRSRYEAMIVAMDTEIGKLLDTIDRDNTFVFFLSDNGTPPDATAPGQDPARVKGSVYEGGINVPLIVTGPGITPGTESQALVSLTDLFATVLELAHLPVPAGHAIDSVSFAQQLFDPTLPARQWVYSQEFMPNGNGAKTSNQRAIITDRLKWIQDGNQEFLYNLANDPGERAPLAPGRRQHMVTLFRQGIAQMRAEGAP